MNSGDVSYDHVERTPYQVGQKSVNYRSNILSDLEMIEELPSLPQSVFVIEEVAMDPDSSAADLAEVVGHDPAFAARLLKVANSSYYLGASDQEIASIQAAVARLGFVEVRRMCLSVGIMRSFIRPSKAVNHRAFWEHSLTAAAGARAIAAECSAKASVDADTAFVAGLLHEVGSLVLDQFFPHEYAEVHQQLSGKRTGIHQLERSLLETDHAEVGAYLLQRWNLPMELVQTVRYHHRPADAPAEFQSLAQVVHLADFIATRFGVAGPGEGNLWQLDTDAWDRLGFDLDKIRRLRQQIVEEGERSHAFVRASLTA
ncbi:Ribonuclease Y [Planctomycetes bacterium Pan216]|uniref:Ribonuclease Y n=1 Tax=Kolteria novifilia TaxID=2527975 RepID=A0A518BCY8_9BACT|nr:Ribonuclease Y [Planctomycetes bacterium Pan216]